MKSEIKYASGLRLFTWSAAVLSMVAGVAVLFGWALNVPVLKSVVPGLVTMKANTAVAFILSGMALSLLIGKSPKGRERGRRVAARLLALVVVTIGALTLAEYLTDLNFGLDQLLIRDLGGTGTVFPGRMGANTAAAFAAVGAALLTLNLRRQRNSLSQGFALTATAIALVGVISYAYGVEPAYILTRHSTQMALHTAIVMLLLSIGIAVASPRNGVTAVIFSDTAGGSSARRLLPWVVIGIPMIRYLIFSGPNVGYYGPQFAGAAFVSFLILVFTAIIVVNTNLENRSELGERESEARIRYLAKHDPLTDLPNRNLLNDRLGQAITHADRSSSSLAVLALGFDQLRAINETYGHANGDKLLKETTARLFRALRSGDTVARFGDDEFTIILTDVAQAQDAARVAVALQELVAQPLRVGGKEVRASAGVGISFYPADAPDAAAVLVAAGAALRHAKASGRSQLQFYMPEMQAQVAKRLSLEKDLIRAVEGGEFVVYYQPEVDTRTGRLTGAEALVRWNRPGFGLVMPDDFIPTAEEMGIINKIGEFVLSEAVRQTAAWSGSGIGPLLLSVNLSGLEIDRPGLASAVSSVLKRTGLPPDRLELEVTETAVMRNFDSAKETLAELKGIGVSLAIDDFGTGYSSLSHLLRLNADTLKIDRSFIQEMTVEPGTALMVKAIISLAHIEEQKIVAEGVETIDQLEMLRSFNADSVQGYLFAKPLPATEFERWAERRPKAA